MSQIKLPFYIEGWKSEYSCPKGCDVMLDPIHDRDNEHFCKNCGGVWHIKKAGQVSYKEERL